MGWTLDHGKARKACHEDIRRTPRREDLGDSACTYRLSALRSPFAVLLYYNASSLFELGSSQLVSQLRPLPTQSDSSAPTQAQRKGLPPGPFPEDEPWLRCRRPHCCTSCGCRLPPASLPTSPHSSTCSNGPCRRLLSCSRGSKSWLLKAPEQVAQTNSMLVLQSARSPSCLSGWPPPVPQDPLPPQELTSHSKAGAEAPLEAHSSSLSLSKLWNVSSPLG